MFLLQESHPVGDLPLFELYAAATVVGLHELLPDALELGVQSRLFPFLLLLPQLSPDSTLIHVLQ